MSRRLSVVSVVTLAFAAVACSDATGPLNRPSPSDAATSPFDGGMRFHVVPNLDGDSVTVTGFNQFDVITGYVTTGSTSRVFRAHNSVEYFTPPPGFQPGNLFDIHAGINATGKVAGGVINDTSQRAYIWWHNGNTTLLPPEIPAIPPEGPLGCGAWAISDSGYVVGSCMPNVNSFVTQWAPDGTVIKQTCCGVLTAMSETQYLTGYDLTFDPPIALLWSPGAEFYTLIGVDNGMMEVSEGLAVNANGWVAGWAFLTGPDTSAVLWVPGKPQHVLSGRGVATGVDAEGNVVGHRRNTASGPTTAFVWNGNTVHTLPGFPDGRGSAAVAINTNHEVLGWAIDKQGLKHTVIWSF